MDPKGIRNLGPHRSEFSVPRVPKEIEQPLGDPTLRLESFIVSKTSSATMRMLWNMEKAEMTRRHILFQDEDQHTCVQSMLARSGS